MCEKSCAMDHFPHSLWIILCLHNSYRIKSSASGISNFLDALCMDTIFSLFKYVWWEQLILGRTFDTQDRISRVPSLGVPIVTASIYDMLPSSLLWKWAHAAAVASSLGQGVINIIFRPENCLCAVCARVCFSFDDNAGFCFEAHVTLYNNTLAAYSSTLLYAIHYSVCCKGSKECWLQDVRVSAGHVVV